LSFAKIVIFCEIRHIIREPGLIRGGTQSRSAQICTMHPLVKASHAALAEALVRFIRSVLSLSSQFASGKPDPASAASVLSERRPVPQLPAPDKLFWVIPLRHWPGWKHALVLVHRNNLMSLHI
jgi:hypothetical protein